MLGFGKVSERAIEPGIAAVADLLECPTSELRCLRDRRMSAMRFARRTAGRNTEFWVFDVDQRLRTRWKRLPGNRVMAAG